jgi:hypothetical protein
MQEYRAYILGPDGHIQSRVDIRCTDEKTARERAEQLVDGHDIEPWQRDRLIAMFKRKEQGRLSEQF